MSPKEKMELVRHWFVDVLSGPVENNLRGLLYDRADTIENLFSQHYKNSFVPSPRGDWKTGLAGARQILKLYRGSFPDLMIEIEEQHISDDKVVTRYTITGTHTAKKFLGVKATGKRYQVSALSIDQVENGKIVASWGSFDVQDLTTQMGLPAEAINLLE